jgi:uncharacterized damage-inducible protein DinB
MHMELNPYARFLGSRDPVDVLERTYSRMLRALEPLSEEHRILRPPSGKWMAREIVAHMADCELVFSFRLKQTLAEDNPTVQPFDQERWASRYENHDLGNAVRLFSAVREWNLLLIWETTAAERQRPLTHPERGAMTFWTIVETMAGHDLNHLAQLERFSAPA